MLNFINKNKIIIFTFLITLFLGVVTFLTFIDRSFIDLNEKNLQNLLIIDLIIVFIFFILILTEIWKIVNIRANKKISSKANLRYVTFFSIATLLPSILIAFFSLSLFSFALEKYLDKKVSSAVNNSYEIAKNYVEEIRNNIESDILLVGLDINRNTNAFEKDKPLFINILRNQRYLRRLDEIHLINIDGEQIVSSMNKSDSKFLPPKKKALEMVRSDDRPLKIINAFENRSAALLKLTNYNNVYLYIVKFLDPKISGYLKDSEQAVSFYYTVSNNRTGIKISFALIYLIVVTLLLFLSISVAIKFASRFFKPISNLIDASNDISSGNLTTKVPIIDADEEIDKLNKNFNLMIDRLKTQQDKLLLSERHEAWENVARKLAHEIKNPLTPIQLSIDRLKDKYSNKLKDNKTEFETYLKTINNQIKQIENLVNEFSDFARMPKPSFKRLNIYELISSNVDLMKLSNKKILFKLISSSEKIFIKCDNDQINRVFINLIKNSVESLEEKLNKTASFKAKISIEISEINNYIYIVILDNGVGFTKNNIKNIVKPYYTTKEKGTGLGLAIVNKIINDHDGKVDFISINEGAKITLQLPNNVS